MCGRREPSGCVYPGCGWSTNPLARTASDHTCGSTCRSAGNDSSAATATSGPTGVPTTRSPSTESSTARNLPVAAAQRAVTARYPGTPSACVTAQAAASGPADLDPMIVEFTTG